MIVGEYKSKAITVRIHDEHFSGEPAQCLAALSHVVSKSYTRRALEDKSSIAAMQAVKSNNETLL